MCCYMLQTCTAVMLPEMFYKIGVLKNFAYQKPATLLKRRLRCRCFRSSHQRCSISKGVLRNFSKLTGKHLCQSLFFNKVAGLWPATLLKKRIWQRCFPVGFEKFLRTPFLQNTFSTEHLWVTAYGVFIWIL